MHSCSTGALLHVQVQNLTEEVAALEDENRRLSEVIQADQPHNEELLLHVKELQNVSTPPPPPNPLPLPPPGRPNTYIIISRLCFTIHWSLHSCIPVVDGTDDSTLVTVGLNMLHQC